MAGSPDFIADMAKVKANVDSGLVAPMAMGVIQAFEQDRHSIESVRKIYAERIEVLIDIFEGAGMRLAIQPDAGFFTLWMSPTRAFGRAVESADHFHRLLLSETARRFPDRKIGLEGVPFDPYYRCAVTGHIHKMRTDIQEIMDAADPAY